MDKNKKKALSDAEIASKVSLVVRDAVSFSTSHLANKSEQALRYYKREALPGDEKQNARSKWVSPDVMERVDWLTASMIRTYDSQAEVVQFLPNGPEDEPLAKQQTEVANFVVRSKNSHVAVLEPWIKNGCITGLGIAMVEFRSCTEESLPELLKGVSDEQLVDFTAQEEAGKIVIVEAGEPYQALPPAPGQNVPPQAQALVQALSPMVRDIKIRRVKRMRTMNIVNLPPEDFIVSKDAQFDQQTGGIRAAIQGHRRSIAREDLVEQGFDAEKVKSIPSATDKSEGIALERSSETDYDQGVGEVTDDVTVYEIYTFMKIDGDKRRHYRITLAGDIENMPVLLDYQEVSKFYPYAAFCPFPVPNTLFGYGIADRIGDDQVLLSKMQRGVINSLNMHIDPIKVINPETTNLDDALNLFPGAVIRSSDPAGGISYNQPPFAGAAAMPVIEQIKQTLDFTTGVGGGMMAVNASDLQNTTATATSQRANASQLIVEMICRHFADTGYRYLFKVMIDLFVQHPEDAQAYISRLTNNYVPIKVDEWDPDMDVTATVAFGVMNKDFNAATLQTILGQQLQMMQAGMRFVTPENVFATVTKLVENAGFKNPGAFWTDPATLPPPPPPAPPQPSPDTLGLIQVERVKAELKAQSDAAEREFKLIELRVEDDRKRDEMQQDFALKQAEIQAKYAAQVDIARIQMEQARQRNDVDIAIQTQQSMQAAAERQQQAQQAQQAAEQQQLAQLAHARRNGNDATPFRGGNDATPPQF